MPTWQDRDHCTTFEMNTLLLSIIVALGLLAVTYVILTRRSTASKITACVDSLALKWTEQANGGDASIKGARPVVLIDLSPAVGRGVAAHLMPEFEGTSVKI